MKSPRKPRGFLFSDSIKADATREVCVGALCGATWGHDDIPSSARDHPNLANLSPPLGFLWPLRRACPDFGYFLIFFLGLHHQRFELSLE